MRVLFFVADSVRPDFLGCYGGQYQTPFIDGLAAEGVRFETCRSAAPWTVPSIASMLTGRWAHQLGLVKWEQPWPVATPTMFQAFRDAGFSVSSHVFDPCHLFSQCPDACVAGSSQDTEAMLSRLAKRPAGDDLVFVHYWWTHVPYIARKMNLSMWNQLCLQMVSMLGAEDEDQRNENRTKLIGLYAHAIETLSEQWLPKIMDAAGADVVVFTADHGESWCERMGIDEKPRDVFDLHGNHLHDEVIKVPWIIHAPDLVKPGTVSGQARTVDMWPTLMSLLGLPAPNGEVAGCSLAADIESGQTDPNDAVFARNHDFVDQEAIPSDPVDVYSEFGVCDSFCKSLMEVEASDVRSYDLATDAGESSPTIEAFDSNQPLHSRLRQCKDEAVVGTHDPADYQAMREQLRSLGYL